MEMKYSPSLQSTGGFWKTTFPLKNTGMVCWHQTPTPPIALNKVRVYLSIHIYIYIYIYIYGWDMGSVFSEGTLYRVGSLKACHKRLPSSQPPPTNYLWLALSIRRLLLPDRALGAMSLS